MSFQIGAQIEQLNRWRWNQSEDIEHQLENLPESIELKRAFSEGNTPRQKTGSRYNQRR